MILHRAGGGVILVWFVASFLFIQTLKDLRSNTTNFLANILTGGQLVLTSFSLELVRKRQGIYDTDGAVGTKNKEQLTDRSVAVGARTTKFDIYFAAICHCAAVHAQYCAYFLLESVATLQMLRGVEVWFILAFRYAQMVMSRGKDMESIACPSMSKLAGIALITASFVFAHSTDVRVSRGTPIILVTNMLMPARNIILKQTENSGGFRLLARVFSIVSLVYGSVCICVSSASVTQLISENLPKPQLFFGNIIWGAVYNAASLIYLYRDRVTVLDHAIVSLAKRVFTLLYTCIIDFDVSHWFNMLLTLTGYFLYYKCPSSTLTTRSQRMASAWLLLLSVLLYSLRGKFTYTLQQKPSVPNMVDAYAEELLEIDAPYDRLMTVSGGNIGNYVWQMGARTLVGSQVNRVSLDSRNLTGPTIIPVANILPSYNVSMKYPGTLKASSYLEELVRTSTGPFFIVGLGTQQGFDPDDDELKPHANIIRLFKTIHSKQNVHVAVRGHITSRVLRLSQAEHEVLGCPSLMLNPKKDLGELILQKSKVLADSKEAVFGIALPVNPDGVFISTVVTWLESYPMSSVILQSREDIRSVKKILDDLDTKFVDMLKRVHMFHSLSEWMRYARTLDFMISARIHGSMVTIANEIPTVLLAVDSRTEELGQFMNIPLLRITAMNATAFPPVELVRKHLIDANSFDAHRKELARRYVQILTSMSVEPSVALIGLAYS